MEGTISSGSTVAIIYSRLQIIPCRYIISPDQKIVFSILPVCSDWVCRSLALTAAARGQHQSVHLQCCSVCRKWGSALYSWQLAIQPVHVKQLSTAENVYRAHFLESHLPAVNVYFHTSVPGCVCRLQESQYSGLKLITPHPLPSLKRLLTWNWQI